MHASGLIPYRISRERNAGLVKNTARFDGYFFTIKNNLCADNYAAAVCAMKSTQLKQDRTTRCVTSTQEQYPSLFGKRFNFFVIRKRRSEHKSVFTTNNTHQNQKSTA